MSEELLEACYLISCLFSDLSCMVADVRTDGMHHP
jgi:hypothetical protein